MPAINTAAKCDGRGCTVTTLDYMADSWIVFENGTIRHHDGRDHNGHARGSAFLDASGIALFFCSMKCFQGRLGRPERK